MAEFISEHAPAKVNLALHVTGQRADGYHLLDTLVVFTREGDRIRVRKAARDGFAIVGRYGHDLPHQHDLPQNDNLVLRARNLARRIAGNLSFPVHIELEKNLPVASGIGGGSSDAAATLRALGRLWGLSQRPEITEAALSLGADLPMCLAARTLIARGVGEEISLVTNLPPLALVLVNPGVAIATPSVFAGLDNRNNAPLPALPASLDHETLNSFLAGTRNDLQPAAQTIAPQIEQALLALQSAGATLARMSGSGATCFGIFRSTADAQSAAAAIAATRPAWYVVATTTLS